MKKEQLCPCHEESMLRVTEPLPHQDGLIHSFSVPSQLELSAVK